MYEQNDVPVFRRIIWIALWFLVAVVVIGTLTWLIFFHHGDKKSKIATTHKPATHGQPSKSNSGSNGQSTIPGTNSNSGQILSTNTTTPSTVAKTPATVATTTAPAPTELVNTGAGDLVLPFTIAATAGTVFYHVRTRRKLVN